MAEPIEIRESVPLAGLSTLGVGGPARYFAGVASEAALVEAVAWARERALPLLVLGGGSNLLVADDGFPGLVVAVRLRGVEAREEGGTVALEAAAGEDWDALVALAVSRGWAGFECLSGIPGRVGATPIQNVGAYGQEVRETIERVRAYDLESGRFEEFSNGECGFGYRESRFKRADRGRFVVTAVAYRLAPGGAPAVRYPELERYLDERGAARAGLADVREAVLAIRRRKSMVLDPADPDSRSAGSFFVNPVVSEAEAAAVEHAARDLLGADERVPRYPAAGGVKLSAAWLIERSGFAKGYGKGSAGLSSKHTLAIVNRGGATARDLVALAREVRERVRDRFGVTLAPEPVFVGLSLDDEG